MSSVQEIEQAIGTLSPQELEELYAWMDERHAQTVDTQLGQALRAGAMDERISQALAEHKSGSTRTL